MSSMLICHKGAEKFNLDSQGLARLQAALPPEATETYRPVGHYDLAENVRDVGSRLLTPKGFVYMKSEVGLTKDNAKAFGLSVWGSPDTTGAGLGMAIAWRNSYDRSIAAAVAIGANVFVCDNLALNGEIVIMRRHTKKVVEGLRKDIISTLFDADITFMNFVDFAERMRQIQIKRDTAYGFFMRAMMLHAVGVRPMIEAAREWERPTSLFPEPTAWSAYNVLTGHMKELHPRTAMESHRKIHDLAVETFG